MLETPTITVKEVAAKAVQTAKKKFEKGLLISIDKLNEVPFEKISEINDNCETIYSIAGVYVGEVEEIEGAFEEIISALLKVFPDHE